MNPVRWLLTPWIAAHRAMRWVMATVITLSLLGALDFAFQVPDNPQQVGALYVLYPAVGLMWVYFIPNMLNLALLGQRLRLPGVAREVAASVVLYAVVSTLAPALLLSCFGMPMSTSAPLLALVAGGLFLYALLPWYLAMPACLVPALSDALAQSRLAHLLATSGLGSIIDRPAVIVSLMAVIGALRWWQLTRRADVPVHFLRRPLIFGLSRNLQSSAHAGAYAHSQPNGPLDSVYLLRQRPDWMQRCADLRQAGPDSPQRALRVALGGVYLPQTWMGRLVQVAPLLGVVLILTLLFRFTDGPHAFDHLRRLWLHEGPVLASWFMSLMCVVIIAGTCLHVQRAWTRTGAELPLLALLPGLGDGVRNKRALLRALLGMPLAWMLLVMALMLAFALSLQQSPLTVALALLAPLGCAGYLVASILATVGGWQPAGMGRILIPMALALLFVLACTSTLLPAWAFERVSAPARFDITLGLLGLWLAFALVVVWMGRAGWRALAHRSHPFLVS